MANLSADRGAAGVAVLTAVAALALVAPAPSPAESPPSPPTVAALLAEAKTAFVRDLEAWSGFAFHRHVMRRKLDREGKIVWATEYDFEIIPADGGFVEDLVEIDGREPTRGEVRKHRQAARFEKHYLEAGRLSNPFGPDIPLEELLFDQEYRFVGRELLRGEPCYRLAFELRGVPPDLPLDEELGRSLRGGLCLSVEGAHLVGAELLLARTVAAGAVTMRSLAIGIDAEQIEPGVFVPTRFEMRSDMILGLMHVGRWNRYLYSEFRRAGGPTGAVREP